MEKNVDRYGICTAKEIVTFNKDGWGNGMTYEPGELYIFEHYSDSNRFCVRLGFGWLWFSFMEFRNYFTVCCTANNDN